MGMSSEPKPHSELAAMIDRALASPYGVPYEESHAAREALHSLVEQLEAALRELEARMRDFMAAVGRNEEKDLRIASLQHALTTVRAECDLPDYIAEFVGDVLEVIERWDANEATELSLREVSNPAKGPE